ncbi:hypothetical protein DV735_g1226, partial [Chaetothyriales sp. CBS 134920]
MDEAISQVAAVTGSTPELASQYLQLADGDPNQAVQLFFENGGADLVGATSAATATAAAAHQSAASRPGPSGSGASHNPINVDDVGHISDDNDPEITGFRRVNNGPSVEDDEAMARRLQEEMYGGLHEQEVRAPIARQSETLLGPGADVGLLSGPEVDAAVQARMLEMQQRRSRAAPRGIFNQRETSSIWHTEPDDGRPSLAEATGGASEASARSNMLARLFQPPWDLMFKGSWEDARDLGKEEKKWILVNIQDGSIFDCQALNRDLWKNDGVVDTVKENFVFLQYSKDDPRADNYIQFYFQQHENADMYPHIAIVDPRTGEQIKVWTRKMPSAAEFLMQLHEFLDRYSLDNNARNPVAKRKSEAKKQKPVDQLTEEEMLERALQASMAPHAGDRLQPPAVEDPDDLTRSIGDVRDLKSGGDPDSMSIYENGNDSASEQASVFSTIPSNQPHAEPPQGPGITRIQIRHPAGRLVRRFSQDDPVQRIYEFLKAEPLEGREGQDFELVSMGKNLLESRHETIEAAGLKNGTVMVEFLDGS